MALRPPPRRPDGPPPFETSPAEVWWPRLRNNGYPPWRRLPARYTWLWVEEVWVNWEDDADGPITLLVFFERRGELHSNYLRVLRNPWENWT